MISLKQLSKVKRHNSVKNLFIEMFHKQESKEFNAIIIQMDLGNNNILFKVLRLIIILHLQHIFKVLFQS